MGDYEYEGEAYERYAGDQSDTEESSEEADESTEYVSEYAGIHRAMLLLILVLIIGIVLLGLFIVMRPAPVVVPTLKPPWLG